MKLFIKIVTLAGSKLIPIIQMAAGKCVQPFNALLIYHLGNPHISWAEHGVTL